MIRPVSKLRFLANPSLVVTALLMLSASALAGPAGVIPPREDDNILLRASAPPNLHTNIGNLGIAITDQGWIGTLLNQTRIGLVPSCEYPLNSHVEHLYLGGLWIGGVDVDGSLRVSAGADDTGAGAGNPKLEFAPGPDDEFEQLSRNPLSPYFRTSALADQQFKLHYNDLSAGGGGSSQDPHVAMGMRVTCDVLAYSSSFADDFVILLFEIENVGSRLISDMYLGWYNELTVGNIDVTTPGSSSNGWNFYDDINGYIGPDEASREFLDEAIDRSHLEEDPDIRMMYSYDGDGEGGRAKSWIGVRWLGSTVPEGTTFSYRQWPFGDSVARYDADKYNLLASDRIDVGDGQEQGTVNYSAERNWSCAFSVGPWPAFFPGDKASFAIAYVGGSDGNAMMRNSRIAQFTYDNGFELPAGPPSPVLEVIPQNNQVKLRWHPGEDPGEGTYTPELASPEHHRSLLTGEPDFQGYRIYRILGDRIVGDAIEQASLIAEFDIKTLADGSVDPVGFNRGLPPLDEDGYRVFVDENVLNGFTYYYAVTSYAARDPRVGLPELESGFNVNAQITTPGTAPSDVIQAETGVTPEVGVYPNPYRAASAFDNLSPTSGQPRELGRTIYFTHVPSHAQIDIYNVSGTRVDRLIRDDSSTGQVEWDMLSEHTRAIAPGLYIFTVQNLDTGELQRGKLVILK